MRLNPMYTTAIGALVGGLAVAGPALADDISLADTLGQAVTQGTPSVQVRPRYEFVEQNLPQGGRSDSQAATVRALVGYSTKPVDGLGATIQFSDVEPLNGTGNYNVPTSPVPTGGTHTNRATIPDPRAAGVNQAYISYEGLPDTRAVAGRQIIKLDDERFVGNVDFRQTMQTFDAISVVNKSVPDVKLTGAWLWGLKDILNQQVRQKTFLTEANWTKYKVVQADAFGYCYGNESNDYDSTAVGNSGIVPGAALCGTGVSSTTNAQACNSMTIGGRLHGSFDLPAGFGADYVGAYAHQSNWDGGNGAINARYEHLGGKLRYGDYYVATDYELMGANSAGTYGFQTPLATKHAFNGWAEMFLTTPQQGLRSTYGTVGGKLFGLDLMARYYYFKSDSQDMDLGHELDFSVIYPVSRIWSIGAQYAKFHADNNAANTLPGLKPGLATGLEDTNAGWVFISAGF